MRLPLSVASSALAATREEQADVVAKERILHRWPLKGSAQEGQYRGFELDTIDKIKARTEVPPASAPGLRADVLHIPPLDAIGSQARLLNAPLRQVVLECTSTLRFISCQSSAVVATYALRSDTSVLPWV
ncbi:hypothetical protein L1887_48228 [Cichorium endivia]|nr:hypothetical protein L1887_48228 [Cichorium endivia]